MEKKAQGTLGALIIAVVILAIILGIFYFANSSSITGNTVKLGNPIKNCRNVQMPYQETETYTETVQYTDKECEQKNLAYNIQNTKFDYETCNQEEEVCINYILGICSSKKTFCVSKTIVCSLDLSNLDNEEGGYWTVEHTFIFSDGSKKQTSKNVYLYPSTSENIQNKLILRSEGEEGEANKDATSCNYALTSIPSKNVCRDVLKYKEEPRTKTITKYRTEEICN